LDVTHGRNILIADTPDDFADAVVGVLQDPGLRGRLSQAGRKLVEEKYSSTIMGVSFNSLLERVVHSK
jgi:glycosyltransferase involved in cell wall biosynthesis